MSALTVNAQEVPVFASSGSSEHRDRAAVGRRYSGALTYTRRGTTAGIMTHARTLEVSVRSGREWTRSQVEALQDELNEREWHDVAGDLWGEASEAEARDVERRDGPLEGIVTLSFTLHERGPSEGAES